MLSCTIKEKPNFLHSCEPKPTKAWV